jgi:hypothetical protein
VQTITVAALVGGKRLEVGRYADAAVAEAVATSWAKWSGCRAAIVTNGSAPPLVLIRPAVVSPAVPVPR